MNLDRLVQNPERVRILLDIIDHLDRLRGTDTLAKALRILNHIPEQRRSLTEEELLYVKEIAAVSDSVEDP